MWSTLIPFVGVALALLFVPGVLVNLVAGFRPWQAIGFAPLVSTAVIAVGAIVWQFVAVPWGPLPIALTTVLAAGFALGARLIGRRWLPSANQHGATAVQRQRPAGIGWTLGGWLIGAVLMSRDFAKLTGGAANFSQTFDNIFHLNAVRWITEYRQGSSLDMRMTAGLDVPAGFYPTGWHDIVSGTLLTLGSTDVVRATSAVALVVTAVVWPLGCLLLGRRLFRATPVNQLAIGALSASFSAFPYLILGFGVLYPNLLGLCLLPAMVAVALDILKLSPQPEPNPGTSWGTAVMGLAALALSHPNVALTMVDVIGVILIVCWSVPTVVKAARTHNWTQQARLRSWVLAGWLVGAAVALKVIRPPVGAGRWQPWRIYWDALVETVTVSPLEASVVWVSALLVLLGATVEIAHRHYLLVLLHAGMAFMWFIAASVPMSFVRDLIVGPWYGDSYRLASLLPLFAVPLAAIGLDFLVSQLARLLPVVGRARAATAVLVVAALIGATQFGTGKGHVIAWANSYYGLDARPGGNLITTDEYELIQRMPGTVPATDVVAVNPWNGGSMAYALAGVHTNHTHVLYSPTKLDKLINNHLNQASTSPAVCEALAAENVRWVLDFGNQQFLNALDKTYLGFVGLDRAEGFEPVDRQGEAVLYRITACG